MPKASEEARRARRRAEERLSVAYGWPDKRTRATGIPPAVAVALVILFGIALVIVSGWHG